MGLLNRLTRCDFYSKCTLAKDEHTCNHESEAQEHCGKYWKHVENE
ncbi:hypothetical protein HWN40_06580 [Methanolobus zinderi]|uniref:Uncharacterized protein n=1 Tax=Methanolobus zinderi TaxID=536044 RepID=A0A7D5E983_9EURY|nr:hypothetical protein [Methanolobus zinderi]QLC49935.1 hypothetical protein HWN40_06580 [Methanolobus zinderi]